MGLLIGICIILCIICAICALVNYGSNDTAWGTVFAVSLILFGLLANNLFDYSLKLKHYKTAYSETYEKVESLQEKYSNARVQHQKLLGELKVTQMKLDAATEDAHTCSTKLENISELLEK